MDCNTLEKEVQRLLDKLKEEEIGSEEYQKTQKALENLYKLYLEDEQAKDERIDKAHTRDLREQEIEERRADSKRKVWGTIGAAIVGFFGTIAAVGGALHGQKMLKETKEDQGMVDRDEFSMSRSMFPKP